MKVEKQKDSSRYVIVDDDGKVVDYDDLQPKM